MTVGGGGDRRALRLLLDTNVVISLEPYGGDLEARLKTAAELHRLASQQGHSLFVHPATKDDLLEDRDDGRRAQRLAELGKYQRLVTTPVPADLRRAVGEQKPGSNGERDLRILSGLVCHAVDFLVSDDRGLRRWAARVGREDSVLTVAEMLDMLRQLAPAVPAAPPLIERPPAYALEIDDPIFDSLRQQYGKGDFDDWLDRVRADHDNRACYVVRQPGPEEPYAGLGIVKWAEPDNSYGFPAPVTKISTFKVGDHHRGRKYGELLLKAIFKDAHDRDIASLYVEVFDDHTVLCDQLRQFGFEDHGHRTERGELVLLKQRRPDPVGPSRTPLQHHVHYGPPAISGAGQVHVIPIQPKWHTQLFPDAPTEEVVAEQLTLLPPVMTQPWGNALRKAYLCHSPSTQIREGDTLLFYRSTDHKAVTAVGVVESTLRSGDPTEVLGFVGQRTVYSPAEVTVMCARVGGVLAIRFRQDRFIDPEWSLAELQHNKVLNGWPQSVTMVGKVGAAWVHEQLSVSH